MTGRPAIKPSRIQRDHVRRLAAKGWAHDRIAKFIGLSRGTLLRHFAEDIEHGADIRTAQLLEAAERAARRGNMAAIRWLVRRSDVARAAQTNGAKP